MSSTTGTRAMPNTPSGRMLVRSGASPVPRVSGTSPVPRISPVHSSPPSTPSSSPPHASPPTPPRPASTSSTSSHTTGGASELLSCEVCLESYDDGAHHAKFLTCHHTFCVRCLQTLVREKQRVNSHAVTIECPHCRSPTSLPENGVAGLQTNFYIDYMRETFEKIGQPKMKGCNPHSNQPMSFFCETCTMAICRDCTVLDHKEAAGHVISNIAQADVKLRQALSKQVSSSRPVLIGLQQSMKQLELEAGMLTAAKDVCLRDAENAVQQAIQMLEERRNQLNKSIVDIHDARQEKLDSTRNSLLSDIKTLNEFITNSEKVVKNGQLSDVVMTTKKLSTFLEETLQHEKFDLGHNYMAFSSKEGLDNLKDSVNKMGNAYFKGRLATNAKFQAKSTRAGHYAEVMMEVFDHQNEKLDLRSHPVTVEITDPTGARMTTGSMTNDMDMQVSFTPQISGLHKICATFHGHRLASEQTHISIGSNNPILRFGDQGSGHGLFVSPRAIALDADENVYVADTGNRLIQKLSPDGQFIDQFSVNGHNEDCSTCDLAIDKNHHLILCTETVIGTGVNPTMGHNMLVYDMKGKLEHVYSNKVMRCALCIAVNSLGEIIVSDYLIHALFVYDKDGTYKRRIGNAQRFNHPAFICVGHDDIIIVSDTNNDCIQVFDREGKFIRQFGTTGSGKGQLKQPFGVATDGEYILVVDSGNKRVQVFTVEGVFVSAIESKSDPLLQPRGIAVTTDGHVYVADRDHHCIKKYRYRDMPKTSPPSSPLSSSP